MPMSPEPRSRKPKQHELFYWQDHKRQDAALHNPILTAGDHRRAEDIGIAIAKSNGLTDDECDALFGRH